MALGIDGIASAAAIAAKGRTVAVLGCGIDRIYPPQHITLCELIMQNGAIITEFAPGTAPKGSNFPIRNRIISGLSRSTLVIEGNTNSGSMLTAREAIRQGRDIFAIPGNVGVSNALGTNVLIRDGARVALSARDIIGIRGDRGIDLDRLADAELNSNLDINILRYYGVSPAAYIAEPSIRDEIGRLEELPEKKEPKRCENKIDKKNSVAEPEMKSPKSSLAPLPDGIMKDIYDSMPIGTPVSADFFAGLGIASGELVGQLSMLEVMGYITSSPGGTYLREI
jgi:predicted Rossmann fold nucleotide-binding protein DprA/Smf involved in DNA uptake